MKRKKVMATPAEEVSSIQDKEILEIKSQYPGQIEVLSCNGKFQNVVMLNFRDLGLQLKFQLTDDYPNSAARVSVRSTTLSHDQQKVLTHHLQEEAELKRGQQMMQNLADTAIKWLECNNSDLFHRKTDTENKDSQDNRKEKKSEHWHGKTDNSGDNSNSTPAKTSAMNSTVEVIYIKEDGDRTMEESTGAVGGQHSEENIAESLRDFNFEISVEELSIDKPVHHEENHDPYYRRRTGYRNTGKQPNFFLSLDITNKVVRENATKVQRILSSSLPNYANYIEPESSLHITLALMNLKGKDEISQCSNFLKNMKPNLVKLAKRVPLLNLRGVGNFGEGIIYAKVEDSPRFFEFVYFLKESLENVGVCIINQNAIYTPHLTLIKCPRGMTGKASPDKIAQCILRLQDVNFGTQKLDYVHLYKMGRVNGTYIETAVIAFI